MINRVVLVGRLTKDPESRQVGNNGSTVCSFTLAVSNRFSKDNQKQADFIPCQVWNRPAEVLVQYAHKGSLIGVEGRISTRNYESDGKRVYVTEVVCDSIQLLESKNASSSRNNDDYSQNDYSSPRTHEENHEPTTSRGINIDDEDLPF